MPTPIVSRKRVNLVDDHHPQIAEQPSGVNPRGNQHHFQRFGSRQEAVGRVAEDLRPASLRHVAVPEGRAPADQPAVALQTVIEVVQQRLDRADVERAQRRPPLREHPRDRREKRRLRLAAGGRRQDDQVLAGENPRNHRVLKRPQLAPAEAVDHVVLKCRVELFKVAHSSSSIWSTPAAPIAWRSIPVSSASSIFKA